MTNAMDQTKNAILSKGTWNRKDIAQLLGCSPRTVGTNETKWGLRSARVNMPLGSVHYNPSKVLMLLRKVNVID